MPSEPKAQLTSPENAPAPPLPPFNAFEPVTSRHQVKTAIRVLHYEATFGSMPIANQQGEVEANLSYTSYILLDDNFEPSQRPLMFLFNGGPGSSSVWLHLGGLGPRRVEMGEDGSMPPPPFRVVENEFTWLAFADLVFIDPVDTGFSRAATPELTKRFLAVNGDLELNGEFVRRYLSRSQRWPSPLFLAGESYGTFRAAGLAGELSDKGIIFNGIILISSVLELGTLLFESGDDLPFVLYLPAYTATAWHHQRLAPDLQQRALPDFLPEVEAWSLQQYAPALAAGSKLPGADRETILAQLAHYSGLPIDLIDEHRLRIDAATFTRNLLRDQDLTAGRLDSRHTGYDPERFSGSSHFDPSMSAIRAPFTAAMNDYVRRELGYSGEEEYHILRNLDWSWGAAEEGTPRTNPNLEAAFSQNPYLQVLVASGYFDLATPYFATHYTFGRLDIEPGLRQQIRLLDYPGGHMIYLPLSLMAQMQQDVATFVQEARSQPSRPLPAAVN